MTSLVDLVISAIEAPTSRRRLTGVASSRSKASVLTLILTARELGVNVDQSLLGPQPASGYIDRPTQKWLVYSTLTCIALRVDYTDTVLSEPEIGELRASLTYSLLALHLSKNKLN
jgi:hypothetical protein